MNIIGMIIARDCHVSLSNRAVIKHVISRLKNGYNTFRTLSKEDRRYLMERCIEEHKENQKLYDLVTKGF